MIHPDLQAIPVYVNPLIGPNQIMRVLKDTPQEYLVVDKLETLRDAIAQGIIAMDNEFLSTCGITKLEAPR